MMKVLKFLGTNEIVLGICSLIGIVSFCMTLYVSIKTANIAKILRYNQITDKYNSERKAFLRTFEGHKASILEDGIRSEKILKDILKHVEAYRLKFSEILTWREKLTLSIFVWVLKRPADKVNFNTVCNHLSLLSGRLLKEEERRNG